MELNLSNIITILTIVFTSGGTLMYIRTALEGLQTSFADLKKDTKDDISNLSKKIEQHNNFGLQLVEIKTRLIALEKHIDNRG